MQTLGLLLLCCLDIIRLSKDKHCCFSCESINGSNPGCEDTFHYDGDQVDFVQPCMTGRKGRMGLYPGSVCIKISGYSSNK